MNLDSAAGVGHRGHGDEHRVHRARFTKSIMRGRIHPPGERPSSAKGCVSLCATPDCLCALCDEMHFLE